MFVTSGLAMDRRLAQISLRGRLDELTGPSLRRVLLATAADGVTRAIVDLRELEDVDPAVAGVLLEFSDRFADVGGWLWLVHGADPAGSSLRRMGLHPRLASSPSRAAAGWVDDVPLPIGPQRRPSTAPARRKPVRTGGWGRGGRTRH